ncbi:MAG TPA: LLM class flavin-dependent oxidoreductase [Candidatus Dormibacteraeota bacterium]|nr:LLM class flavin-dependent oxidoreductase [Candidatus Dormibacteraeota bacterium]
MRVGLCLSGNVPMKEIVASAVAAESAGWDSIWLGEDYFYRGGATMAAAVAAATGRLRIGLGIMTPLPRHPALTAMEIGALQELSGGRVLAGIGAGVSAWMRQMGFDHRSPLTVMREGVELVRRLLAGERVSFEGRAFTLDAVQLQFPTTPTPVLLGAVGPKALRLAGEVADGTVLSVLAGPDYVRWARARIREGQEVASRTQQPHLVVAYLLVALADTEEAGRDLVRPLVAEYLSAGGANPLTREARIPDEVVAELNREYLKGRIPVERVGDEVVDTMAAAGPGPHCADRIRQLAAAGADVVALLPVPLSDASGAVRRITAEVLPLLAEDPARTGATAGETRAPVGGKEERG